MNEIESTETTLELDQLETRALGLVWGLTSSVSKDDCGNVLLSRLATAFGEEYALRTGKLSLLGNTEHEFEFDFEQFSVEDLKPALFHFCALTAAFEKNNQRSASRFCKSILDCIVAALEAHDNPGHT